MPLGISYCGGHYFDSVATLGRVIEFFSLLVAWITPMDIIRASRQRGDFKDNFRSVTTILESCQSW